MTQSEVKPSNITIPGQILPSIINIYGCGALGEKVAQNVIRFFGSTSMYGQPLIRLVDQDRVEQKNLRNQDFHTLDVGRYKGEVIAAKFRVIYPNVFHVPVFLAQDNHFAHELEAIAHQTRPVVNFICFDNFRSRRIVIDMLYDQKDKVQNWITFMLGNEIFEGTVHTFGRLYGHEIGTDPRTNQPKIANPDDRGPRANRCLEIDAEELSAPPSDPVEQILVTNLLTASAAFNNFYLMIQSGTFYEQWYIDIRTGMSGQNPLIIPAPKLPDTLVLENVEDSSAPATVEVATADDDYEGAEDDYEDDLMEVAG